MTTSTLVHHVRGEASDSLRWAAVSTAAAAVVNAAAFGAFRLAGVSFTVPHFGSDAPTEVSVVHVLGATVIGLAVGWIAVGIAGRRQRPTLRTTEVTGGVVALVSVAGPLSLDAGLGTRLVLAVMHLIAGAAFVAGVDQLRRHLLGGAS